MKETSINKPLSFERSGNNKYVYRWNIIEKKDEENEDVIWYSYDYVYVYAPISANKITQIVMNEIYGPNNESKFINDYNSVALGVLDDSYIDKYKNFLEERKRIKEKIDTDCRTCGIPKM